MDQPQLSEEIIYLRDAYKEIVFQSSQLGMNYPTANWKILFDYYNRHSGARHLGMGCRPCYRTVYKFITQVLKSLKVIPDAQPK